MATLEKLTKSLEALKVIQPSGKSEEPHRKLENLSKKERIFHCSTIADSICSHSLRSSPEFQKVLGCAMETFLLYCNDDDSDVRLMADECLNKTVKTLLDTHLNRLQLELYKEIKKDGAARSLRAALNRFADLCHRIRPEKFRPYAVNLFPCLVKMCQRTEEESVQDTLAASVTKIMSVLGQFANDKEIEVLLKAFLPNLSNCSATVRRSAATSLITVCQHSRRSSIFFSWLLTSLFDMLLPVQIDHSVHIILGVLLCLRHLIPCISDVKQIAEKSTSKSKIKDEDFVVSQHQVLKIYEITLFFTSHMDHNVVAASLETLYQLLKLVPEVLHQTLICPYGISHSLIYTTEVNALSRTLSGSQNSVVPSQTSIYDDSVLEDDHDIYLSEKSDEESRVCLEDISRNSFEHVEDYSSNLDFETEDVSEYSSVKIPRHGDDNNFLTDMPGVHTSGTPKKIQPLLKKGNSDNKVLDTDDELWEDQNSSSSPSTKSLSKVGNIGTYTDSDLPVKYCARLLSSSFLLSGVPGGCISDRNVRVSIKSLALGCLGCVFSIYPQTILLNLYLDFDITQGSPQKIWDIILYITHPDPHLRGQCTITLSHFINHALRESQGWWLKWMDFSQYEDFPTFHTLFMKIVMVVQDSSSVAIKLALSGLKQCLNSINKSSNGFMAISVLDTLLSVRNNSYWLVKVELLDVLSEIQFKVVHYLESKKQLGALPFQHIDFQTRCLNIFVQLLGDEDYRVRQAAAAGLVKLVPNLFFPLDHSFQDPLVALAKEETGRFFDLLQYSSLHSTVPFVHALVMPFSNQHLIPHNDMIEKSLTRVINILVITLRASTNKYLSFGCCQALCLLSETYLMTLYHQAWKIVFSETKSVAKPCKSMFRHQNTLSLSTELSSTINYSSDLFGHLLALLSHTSFSLDLMAHLNTLQLVGNLMCGSFFFILHEKQKSSEITHEDCKSNSLKENVLKPYTEQLFIHLMRLLNIFAHVLDEIPPVIASSRPALPSLSNASSLSPMKRKHKMKEEALSSNSNIQNKSPTRSIPDKSETDREKTNIKSLGHIGIFHLSPLYTKLYVILKGVYTSYKVSADFQSSEKFCQLLKCCLDVLSQLLEISDSQDMGKHAEEILEYLKSVVSMEPCSTVQCVRQLLKSLFGTNLTALHQEAVVNISSQKVNQQMKYSSPTAGLYHTCITEPFMKFSHVLVNKNIKSSAVDIEEDLVSLSWMKRSDKLTNLLKSGTKCDKANLAAHIKLFEAVVIKALKLYTITSNVNLQCQVLDLLAQLVQLRVNYCLLDSDQIFIGFIMKQIECIEEGQILNAGLIIPRIFYFLMLLSYERYHSKSIISVPKILQLCDGLIASGQPPEDYVIKALHPVVEDLFLVRGMNKVDLGKELDAQREVVISTLFKLLQYPQVLELFLFIVNQTLKEGEDKWRKLSRQIVDALLPLLARQQLQVDKQVQLNILHKLLEAVAASVFRPVDILLKALFTQPKDLNSHPNLHRWICMVLAIIRIIINQSREEVILSRMHDMGIVINIYKLHRPDLPFLLEEKNSEESSHNDINAASSDLARFLFQVVGVSVETICRSNSSFGPHYADLDFLCQQISHLLLYLMNMFQSGLFRKLTSSAMDLVKLGMLQISPNERFYYSISEINALFMNLCSTSPTLVIQWCNVLTLLNYDCQNFWSQVLLSNDFECEAIHGNTVSQHSSLKKNEVIIFPCNSELVRRAGVTLLCDYICDNPNDAELMTMLIVNHVNDLVRLSTETTVKDFLSSVHRNPSASGLLIQAVNTRCTDLSQPVFMKQVLHCLEAVHDRQSANLLSLLIEKILPTHCVVLARNCEKNVCKRIETLLDNPMIEQLLPEDIDKLMEIVISSALDKRHHRVLLLLKKLHTSVSDEFSPLMGHPLVPVSTGCQNIELNKDWFIKFVKELCFSSCPLVKECALLLCHLKYEDAIAIMSAKEFDLHILRQCLKLGAERILSSEKCVPGKSNDPFLGIKSTTESSLYRASKSTLLLHITNLVSLIPITAKWTDKVHEIFANKNFGKVLCYIASATASYLKILKYFYEHQSIPEELFEDIVRISILCCEVLSWILTTESKMAVSPELLHLSLELLSDTLKNPSLFSVIALPEHTVSTCYTINAIYKLIIYLNRERTTKPITFPLQMDKTLHVQDQFLAQKACVEIAMAVEWLEKYKESDMSIPHFIYSPLKSVIIGLSRLPLVNSFSRTPPILWQLGWKPDFSGEFQTVVPPPPGEYLQDRDVLKQYIYRVNLLGWISRQQFEETWMALLGVLSATPIDEIGGKEEDQEHIRTSCLAVKSITSLLLQTLFLPEPGNPQNSSFLVQPRDKSLAFLHTKSGKKMMYVRGFVHRALQELDHYERIDEQLFSMNAERVSRSCHYSLSQVSLEYLCASAGFLEENEEADESVSSNSSPLSATLGGSACFHQREQCLAAAGLDIHSCLHFLLDLYSQWLSPVTCPCTPRSLLTEVVRSVVILSDIFMERAQFEWLLDTLLEVQKVHPAEDEIIAQYLIFGICKSAAVLGLETDILERLKKLLELNLKSSYLPTQIATLHGFMFLLEQGGGDNSFPLLSVASEYILKHLDSSNVDFSAQNEDHMLIIWAVSFYIIENYQDDVAEFSQKIFDLSLNICGNDDDIPTSIYLTILYGLERLLVAGVFSTREVDLLLKLTADRITSSCPLRFLTAFGLLLSCMYVGKSNNLWSIHESLPLSQKVPEKCEGSIKQLETDCLIAALERVTILFERIRKGFPIEASVICQVLPPFLIEFFPVQDILNKVIGEFLSSQQPHPQLIAGVIYEVFQYLHMQSYEDIIQDWVMLSLSNFTQRSPMSMAIWSLSCFFISAASNSWLQALFPYIQNRMGKNETTDKTLFCVSGMDFRNNLKDEEQKQSYFATLQSVSHPDTPYADLLSCL